LRDYHIEKVDSRKRAWEGGENEYKEGEEGQGQVEENLV
jgi:hypothetical protein